MDHHAEIAAKSAAAADEQEEHSKVHKRPSSPHSKNVIFYDCDLKTVKVKNASKIPLAQSDKDGCQTVVLPRNGRQVTIFVDRETESEVTTKSTEDGRSNIILTNLYLDKLDRRHQLQRFFGILSTLYVMSAAPVSEVSSQTHRWPEQEA
ncbi:uncharacterized protein KY384_002979 [Bacidia gigantensis]|uniref:uncharacterized protein n=1 Tax=Bacidia gigantensis TaxID=2732470 RepID=UPI001D055BC6|nr:uncharacterized protein KY384_002979 [Bacidia gigantensis]KAG8531350.1 hypothetical protein KY384_002979 [Bacidia gigantensis]